jgi:hypothetical protein
MESIPPAASVRARGTFLLQATFLVLAAGFVVVAAGGLAWLVLGSMTFAERGRSALGITSPAQGSIDWLLLGASAAAPALVLLAVLVAWRGYVKVWKRRLVEVWPVRSDRSRYSRWRRLPMRASKVQQERQRGYLAALLASPPWRSAAEEMEDAAGADYPEEAAVVLSHLEKDIAERAITTGLIVGISRHRVLDLLTIALATFEMQLHVLSLLGKRPAWYTWGQLIERCFASLFVNTYLNRGEAVQLNLAIKKLGLGVEMAGELTDEAAEHLSDLDLDFDELLSGVSGGLLGTLVEKGITVATVGLTVGSVGLQQMGRLVDTLSDELLQGTLAGGILYYHGMALAADVLALDQAHRASPEMSRTFLQGAWGVVRTAGLVLRSAVQEQRRILREKRKQVLERVPQAIAESMPRLRRKPRETETDTATTEPASLEEEPRSSGPQEEESGRRLLTLRRMRSRFRRQS